MTITRNLTQPLTRAITRAITQAGAGGGWTPALWFLASEQGIWLDPSDFSTMFQDSAGTTPVTAVEQPVGLILDKRLGLTPGTELFATATSNNASVIYTGGVATFTASTTSHGIVRSGVATAGKWFKVTLRVVSVSGGSIRFYAGSGTIGIAAAAPGTYTCIAMSSGTTDTTIIAIGASVNAVVDQIDVRELPGNHATQPTAGSRPKLSARKNWLLATTTLSTQSVTVVAASYVLSFTGTGTITLTGASTAGPLVGTGVSDRVSLTFTPSAGSVTFTVSGSVTDAQLEYGSTAGTYQRVTTATDYDTVGFPHYLKFDGVDDFLSTGSIDFTATDKMTAITGIMKGSDAARAIAYELSADINTNNGSFALEAPDANAAATLRPRSKGTVIATTSVVSLVAGRKMVVTQQGDIAADAVSLRVDGADAGSSATDQGTGNYGNYPLYIGRRAGTSLPANMGLYQLTVRGAATADVTPGESHAATKSGVTL